jgi:pyridoxal phosphate enzyme (YggS family)
MTSATIEEYATRLGKTLPMVRDRIADAAARGGRSERDVRLVAVTKGHPLAALEAALEVGLMDLGENRVGELESKRAAFGRAEAVTWHFIGHIQSRKAGRAVAAADIIQSIDSGKLARKVSKAADERGRPMPILLQVNTSGESAKGGFEGEGLVEELHAVAELPGLEVRGLMTMAPFVDDEAVLAATFGGLRELSERLRSHSDLVGVELSMGMTNDLDVAIREGSTMVRIGTALFGERNQV